MMLYKAVNDCLPGARLQIVQCLRGAITAGVTGGDVTLTERTVERLKSYMKDLVGRDIRFERKGSV